MKHVYIISFILILFLQTIQAQTYLTISINDSKSGQSLPYSNLRIKDVFYSSDKNGKVIVSNHFKPEDSTFISLMGYKKWKITFSTLQKNNIVLLEEDTLMLAVAEVRPSFDNAKKVLRRVVKNLSENYITTPYAIDSYHRSSVKINDTLVKYNEISSIVKINNWNEVGSIKITNALYFNKYKGNLFNTWNLFIHIEGGALNFDRHIHIGLFSP